MAIDFMQECIMNRLGVNTVPEAKGPESHQTTQPTVDLCPVEPDSQLLPGLVFMYILHMPFLLMLTSRARNYYLSFTTNKVPSR